MSLITGYFREYESVLLSDNDNNPYYNVPQLSILVTLSYYAVIECFEIVPKNMILLSNDDRTITKTALGAWGNTCWGKQVIDPSKDKGHYKWLIKIEKMRTNSEVGFGSDFNNILIGLYHTAAPYYTLDCYFGYIDGTGDKPVEERPCFTEAEIKSGDIICLEFNIDGDNSYIRFSRVGTNEQVTINADEIKMDGIKYRLAVSVANLDDSFSILDFQCL